jgi:hypothetical protein
MHYLAATLHTLGVHLHHTTTTTTSTATARRRGRDGERGAVTIENVLWAVAAIAFTGIVVAAITAYVVTKAGLIR